MTELSSTGLSSTLGSVVAAVAADESYAEVVRAAADVATRLGTGVLPVHALPVISGVESDGLAAERAGARQALLEWFTPEIERGLRVLEPIVEPGEASSLVARVADEVGARLVVTAGGQRPTLRRWMIGSVAERIVRRTLAPVWVARGVAPGDVRRVVCALDLSPVAAAVLDEAVAIARAFEAELRVVTVVEQGGAVIVGRRALERFDARVEAAHRRELLELYRQRDVVGVSVETDVRAGKPATQILESALDADLVVLGKSSHGHIGALGLGGTAEKVVRGAWCSVLAVRTVASRTR